MNLNDKRQILPEVGSTGLQNFRGYITEEFLPDLRGRQGMKRFREMRDNSAIVGACFEAITKLVRQFRIEWTPVSNDPAALRAARLLNETMGDMDVPIMDALESIIEGTLTFGVDLKERVLKRRQGYNPNPAQSSKYTDGLWTWGRFAERAIESGAAVGAWDVADDGLLISWKQSRTMGGDVTIPGARLLHFRTRRAKGNPEGRSVLRNCWFAWFFQKRITEAEAIGVSRDLTGIPVADVPPEWFGSDALPWQQALLESIKETVTKVARGENEGIIWPKAYDNQQPVSDIRLLASGGKRQFDTSAIIERYDRRIAMVLMADVILMGHEATGSFAMSDNKVSFLEAAVQAHLQNALDVLARDVPLIMRLNGWPDVLAPRPLPTTPKQIELGALGDFVQKMIAAGFQWGGDRRIEARLRAAADLPLAGEDE